MVKRGRADHKKIALISIVTYQNRIIFLQTSEFSFSFSFIFEGFFTIAAMSESAEAGKIVTRKSLQKARMKIAIAR